MYSDKIRDEEYRNNLLKYINCEYGIAAKYITPAKRGFYGETWKLSASNADYFLKVVYAEEHKPSYERSFPVIRHLCDHGIYFINKIVKTTLGCLYTTFDDAIVGLFDWIDGDNIQNEATKIEEYKMLAQVYTVPAYGIDIAREDFTTKDADEFFERWSRLDDKQVLTLLEKNCMKIEHRAKRLQIFSDLCRKDKNDFVITHGDAGGNFISNGNASFIVDWDSTKLAPPERDAWFCVHWDWAMAGFRDALNQNGIGYELRNERFAYYCYWFFFFYLNAYLDAHTDVVTIEDYIDGWMADNVKWADAV